MRCGYDPTKPVPEARLFTTQAERNTMFVFTRLITSFVILAVVLGSSSAHAAWTYAVQDAIPPKTSKTRKLNNPTIAEIQEAIAPNTRIDVAGNVDGSNGDRIEITVDNVRLNFANAKKISWRGSDQWNGFLEISGKRVEVLNLKMQVAKGSGRCRGVVIHTPASDVRLRGCSFANVADGLIADGEWARLTIENTAFLKCSDWSAGGMDGGYGLFLEDDDTQADHLRLINVRVTLAGSDQHGIRIAKVQDILIDQSKFGAAGKRSLWAYGIENTAVTNTTFNKGSVLFNLKTTELQTDRPTRHVRMSNCLINHDSILMPLAIYCGKGTQDFQFKDIDINSTTAPSAIEIGWRENGGDQSSNIRWSPQSISFNGKPMQGMKKVSIANDWSKAELRDLKIGP